MTNTKKKTNKRKLLGAVGMLSVSAAMLVSSTFAWFTMNKDLTATSMTLKAEAEGGIVISNEAGTDWKASIEASHSGSGISVRPTSTKTTAAWYHAVSDDINDEKSDQATTAYTNLTSSLKVADNGVGYVDDHTATANYDAEDSKYYLLNKFYIKSSQAEAIDTSTNHLNITKVEATLPSSAGSEALDPAFRVAIKIGSEVFIYGPVPGAESTYNVAGDTTDGAVTLTALPTTSSPTATAITSIPGNAATTANAVEVQVFMYFEGEDAACKSANLTASLDEISVKLGFGLTSYPKYNP